MDNLKRKIRSYTSVSDQDLTYGLQFYKEKHFKKGEFIIKPGQFVNHFYFLEKGCVCYYTEDDLGIHVMEFFTDNTFFTDLYSYIENVPSENYVKATENCIVQMILKEDVIKSYNFSHDLERFGRISMQEAFVKIFQKTNDLKTLTNQERYIKLLDKRPDLFQRLPQYLIASYLGITPVGLSKIRKRVARK
ncbi:Crp/Fnr family transcriptional regulator [Spongiivirga sp. MCCC 1A20706]|uniref:Crp/Fnr family transcriptional regulator n=1 Tax=Spongiivirga sp. MCCC 1A20706 TaxID=3160963 RepID=UPI003977E1BC